LVSTLRSADRIGIDMQRWTQPPPVPTLVSPTANLSFRLSTMSPRRAADHDFTQTLSCT
jgi:hypothetical protein